MTPRTWSGVTHERGRVPDLRDVDSVHRTSLRVRTGSRPAPHSPNPPRPPIPKSTSSSCSPDRTALRSCAPRRVPLDSRSSPPTPEVWPISWRTASTVFACPWRATVCNSPAGSLRSGATEEVPGLDRLDPGHLPQTSQLERMDAVAGRRVLVDFVRGTGKSSS